MATVETFYLNRSVLLMPESLPELSRGAWARFKADCGGYTVSYYDPAVPLETINPQLGVRCENLKSPTFRDGSLDLVLPLDVFEHSVDPDGAINKIGRVFKHRGTTQSWICDNRHRGR